MGSRIQCASLLLVVFVLWVDLCFCLEHDHHEHGHQCGLSSPASAVHDHHHDYAHDHHHDSSKLPEELAEEEDLKLYGFGYHHVHDHGHYHHQGDQRLSGLGLWAHALGCSFLVSMASLICLIILPLIFVQGKPSKGVVDSLALFGAGAMLGDAFLHQLPHAFGGEHSHDHHVDDLHNSHDGLEHGHGHSLKDLSVGISILAGIVLFLLVEKLVRYVEQHAGEADAYHHGHHPHHQNKKKLKDDKPLSNEREYSNSKIQSEEVLDNDLNNPMGPEHLDQEDSLLRKRKVTAHATNPSQDQDSFDALLNKTKSPKEAESSSNLVFGYLNLFSDGVHNFTDGMALGSAFLLYGSVGGWSRTLFLLAHELPQEVGDFGILVRSGFSVSKALFFNFLSALVALGGTATALLWGQDPGLSSLIEGFTAGGFIYIAVAGVLAEINDGSLTLKNSIVQLISLVLGMGVALCISLVE